MGFWSNLCMCGSASDEVASDQAKHPAKEPDVIKHSGSELSRLSEKEHLRSDTESPADDPIIPSNEHQPSPAALEESFGKHLLITDDTINQQVNRTETNTTDRFTTEEDRWFGA